MNFSGGFDLKGTLETALGTSSKGRSQFELRIGPFVGGELTVVSFEGHEALNQPFVYDVVFSSSLSEEELDLGIFGFPACLSIHAPKPHEPRVIQGLAIGFEDIGASDAELSSNTRRFMVRIVPRLWLANRQRRSRVFQGKTAPQIAKTVLEANGIKPDVQIGPDDYPAIPFEYQREETDLEFLDRVLATAGIFYYFRHASGLFDQVLPGAGEVAGEIGALAGAAGGMLGGAAAGVTGFVSDAESAIGMTTTLVLTDKAFSTEQLGDPEAMLKGPLSAATGALGGAFEAVASVGLTGKSDSLVFDGNGQAAFTDRERVFSFRRLKELRAKQMTVRNWNLREGTAFTATSRSGPTTASVRLNLSASINLAGKASLGLGVSGDLDTDALPIAPREVAIFEYQQDLGLQGIPRKNAFGAADRALQQERSDWKTAQGETDCRRLAPGYRFTLQQHPIGRVNQEYVVTEARSEGYSPDHLPEPESSDYRCFFRCVPATVDPRPKKPVQRWGFPEEPATVVGPTRGDAYCDSLGRILVRFRWADGDGSFSAESGDGVCWVHGREPWGGDGYGTQMIPRVGSEVLVSFVAGGQPVVNGQIHSQASAPAFNLPREATKVGLKTRVVPNGAESEISIDDNPDTNKILLHSSGDFVTEVVRNTKVELGGYYDLTVAEERRESTNGDATLKFAKDVVIGVAGNLRNEVGKDQLEIVLGSVQEYIEGDASRSVAGSEENLTLGPHRHTFAADSIARFLGHHAVVVAAADTEGQASAVLHVEGAARAYARDEIEIDSPKGFTLICGNSRFTVRKDSITFSSPTIRAVGDSVTVSASDTATVEGKTASVSGSDSVTVTGANKATLAGQSASVILDSNATVQGSKVKLGSGGGGSISQASQKTKPPTRIVLKDKKGKPLANRAVLVRIGGKGGAEQMVVLDADGSLELASDGPIDVRFPDRPGAQGRG
jgi:uncharacterized protein involved in type VI secretion and phage assembly